MILLDDICSRGASLFSSVFAIRGSSWEPVAFGRVLRRISLNYVPDKMPMRYCINVIIMYILLRYHVATRNNYVFFFLALVPRAKR